MFKYKRIMRIPADLVRIITQFVCGDYRKCCHVDFEYWCRVDGRMKKIPMYFSLLQIL